MDNPTDAVPVVDAVPEVMLPHDPLAAMDLIAARLASAESMIASQEQALKEQANDAFAMRLRLSNLEAYVKSVRA